jgi:hypothetical protein
MNPETLMEHFTALQKGGQFVYYYGDALALAVAVEAEVGKEDTPVTDLQKKARSLCECGQALLFQRVTRREGEAKFQYTIQKVK